MRVGLKIGLTVVVSQFTKGLFMMASTGVQGSIAAANAVVVNSALGLIRLSIVLVLSSGAMAV